MTPRVRAGEGIGGAVRRIAATLVFAWLLVAGATVARAQTHYSVVYGTGGAGSGQLSTLRVNAGGGDQVIFQAGDLQTAAGISGATARGRFIKGDGTVVRLGTGYSVRFTATGNVLNYSTSGGNFSFTPSASSPPTQLLVGQVEILTVGSAPTTALSVGEIGTYDIYGGGPASYSAPSVLYDATVTILSPASITGVAPASGPAAGGASVVITGTGLTGATAVSFGGTPATAFSVTSATQISATTPARAAGPVTVSVTAPGGTGTLANAYTYVGAPTVSAVAPATGPSTGGQSVVITGTGFTAGSTVLFGAAAATGVTVDSPTQITAVSPPGTGTVGVGVTTVGGTGILAGAYGYIVPPTVTAAAPTSGPTTGGTSVVITGTNLTGATAVSFGGIAATAFTVNGATQITATTPAGTAGPAAIGVTTPGGAATLANGFSYAAAPTLAAVAPSSGPIAGGTGIVITGANLTGATAVTVGGVAVTGFTVTSATQISATTPAAPGNVAGAAAVAVTTPGGTVSLAGGFTYVAAPTVAARSVSTGYNQSATIDLSASITGSYTAVTLVTGPSHGTLTPGTPGAYQIALYQPAAGYAGPDSYSYTATGPGGTSAAATVSITVGNPTITVTPATLPAGQVATAYSQTLTASGGAAPYGFAATGLPTGLTLAADGTLSGTPTQAGSFAVTVTAQDSSTGTGPFSGPRAYTLVIAAPSIVVAPATLPATSVGSAYTQTVTASGGTGPYSFATTAGGVPGLILSATGTLSGTPSAGGSFGVTITATDAGSFTGARSYTLAVAAPTVTLAPASLPAGQSGTAYSATVTASGGTAPYSYAVAGGALPSGLSLSASGTLAGTPGASGSFTFDVTATDSSGGTGPYASTRSYTLVVGAPTLTLAPATLTGATVGAAYSASITASGGSAPYAYAVTAGALPAGVALAADGTLAGTPSAGGSFAFTVTATDATPSGSGGPYTAARAYTLVVAVPTVTLAPTSLPAGQAGTAYSASVTASGGTAPYTYAVTAGALPAGLSLSASGTLAGTPGASGSFTFDVTATDSSGGSGPYAGTRSYTLVIGAPTLTLAPATLTGATVGAAYSASITASGGTAPYAYAVTTGALPAGLALAADGTLAGTPSAGGSFAFTVTATDATPSGSGGPYTAARAYTLSVATPTVTLSPASLPTGQAGTAYSASVTASGGTTPYTYAVTTGVLPAGLTLSASGTMAGAPGASGSFTFGVTATDSSGGTGPYAGTRSYTLVIGAPTLTLAPATLTGATVGAAYSASITASGGTAPYTYAVTAGALPAGLALAADGTLAGTPSAGGSFAFTVTATDATPAASGGPYTAARAYTLVVVAPTVTLAPASLPAGQAGIAYSASVTAAGGTAPYAYSVTAGALPTGLSLSSSGALVGTPGASGSFTFGITATDSSGGTGPYAGTRSYTLVIGAPTLTLAPATLTGGTVGAAYSASITASGGTAPYSYAVTAGALPSGLTLSASGTLAGTPGASGSFTFGITATDSSGGSGPYAGTRSYTLVIGAPTLTLAPATLTGATVGSAYSASIAASGGSAPYAYAVTAGALPAGLALAADGTLAGTPSAGGSFAFTVTATDATPAGSGGPYTAARAYTLSVAVPTVTLVPASLPTGQAGTAYSASITASGGTGPYTYAVIAGALPSGMSLSSSGTLAGTPGASGSFTFDVTATDSSGGSGPYAGTRSYTLVIGAPTLTLAPATLTGATVGAAYSASITASGGSAPYAHAVTAGALPAGLALAADGTLAGTPSAGGSFAFTVTATDATPSGSGGPYTAARAYTLSVATPTVTLIPASLPAGQAGTAYSAIITASGGTAPYTYAVTAGALPSGLTLSAGGTLTGTPGASGSFTFGITATDSSGGTGPYAGIQAYTVQIGAPVPPVAGDASLTVAYGAAPTPVPLQLGGAATVGVAVATPPAHGTAVAAGTSMTYAPAPGYAGIDRFTYTASNEGGTSAPGTVTVTVTPPPAPTAADRSVTTAYGIPTGVDLSGAIGGVHTGVAIVSAPAHGTASVGGDVVTYTPTAGYYGADSFTYTATGPGGLSAAATVTIAIGAPTIAVTPASLPAGQQGVPYAAILSASGGTAPYRYAITGGSLPAGLVLAATGELAGTPTQSGSFVIAITATDSSTGVAPASGTRSYTLVVAPPAAPIAAGTSVTVTSPAGGTRSIDVSLSSLVSGAWTSIDLVAQPTRGTVTLTTTSGGGGGFGGGGGDAQPIVVATYTPPVGYRGADGFTFVAVGPGGRSAPASVAITVLGSPPVAPTLTAGTGQNVPVTIDLTTQALGAPYTGAAIVSVGPSGSATATLIESGAADNRTYQLRIAPEPRYSGAIVIGYTLSNAVGTSATATTTVTVTARADPAADPTVRGLIGAQAEATRSFAATQLGNFARRNEALHGGGAGSTARPFGVRFTNGLGLYGGYGGYGGYRPGGLDRETALKMEHATEVAGAEAAYGFYGLSRTGLAGFGSEGIAGPGTADTVRGDPMSRRTDPTPDTAQGGAALRGAAEGASTGAPVTGGDRSIGSIAIWSGGAVTVGSRDATTRRMRLDVTSGGLSAGSDIKLGDTLTVGLGGGYGSQRTRIGKGEARLDGDNWIGALYGSVAPLPGAFIDGVIGYGGVDFDSRRRAANGGVGVGHREGTMRFGSLSTGLDRQGPGGMVSAYGRVEYLAATLDAYRETGAGLYDLAYGRRTLNSLSSVLGGRAALYRPIDFGVVSPRMRFEWRHEYRGQGGQQLDYADLGGLTRVVEGDRWLRDEYNLELGVGLQTETDWTFGLDLGGRLGNGSRVGTVRGTVGRKF